MDNNLGLIFDLLFLLLIGCVLVKDRKWKDERIQFTFSFLKLMNLKEILILTNLIKLGVFY
jgi:hypothetical protein